MQDFLENFFKGYVACVLWTGTHDDDVGTPLDDDYTKDDFSEAAREAMWEDCVDFVQDNWPILAQYEKIPGCNGRQAGHDFSLTRNGHGAGFWDRDIGDIGDVLTNLSAQAGESHVYVSDDHELEIM